MDGWKRHRGSGSFAERTSAARRRWTRRRDAADRIGTTTPSEHSLDAWAATITDLQRHGTPRWWTTWWCSARCGGVVELTAASPNRFTPRR